MVGAGEVEQRGTVWKQCGTTWNCVELRGTVWNYVELCGTPWKLCGKRL